MKETEDRVTRDTRVECRGSDVRRRCSPGSGPTSSSVCRSLYMDVSVVRRQSTSDVRTLVDVLGMVWDGSSYIMDQRPRWNW